MVTLCGFQGDGACTHPHEDFHGWRVVAGACWVAPRPKVDTPLLAARLQAYYHAWLLPFERWLLEEHAAAAATCMLPALLVRRLAFDRSHDAVLKCAVKAFVSAAAAGGCSARGAAGAPQIAGRHNIGVKEGAPTAHACMRARSPPGAALWLLRPRFWLLLPS